MSRLTATMSDTSLSTSPARPRSFATLLLNALRVRRERLALLTLDDRMLADVGLSQADAYREAHRSFLDVSTAARRTTFR